MKTSAHRSRISVIGALVACAGLVLTACSADPTPPGSSTSAPGSPAPSTSSPSSAPSSEAETPGEAGTPIVITIGDQNLTATVWDTPTGQDLLDQLPLTLTFEDLSNQEKIGHLEQELTMEGMPEGDDPIVGDLGYYAPWGNVVLYYGDVGYWNGIARIGTINGDLSIISDQTDDFTATLTRAD